MIKGAIKIVNENLMRKRDSYCLLMSVHDGAMSTQVHIKRILSICRPH